METPSWILHPVIFPSSARALSGEGGAVTSLPRTTAAAEGGHLLTEVSAKEWLRPYKPPPALPSLHHQSICPFTAPKQITAHKIKMRNAAPSPVHPHKQKKKQTEKIIILSEIEFFLIVYSNADTVKFYYFWCLYLILFLSVISSFLPVMWG